MQELNPENVSRVPDVPLDEIKERTYFTETVLGPDSISPKDLDGFLPDVEILCSVLNQPGNNAGRDKCSFGAFGHPEDLNPGDNMTAGQLNHSQNANNPFERYYDLVRQTIYTDLNERSVNHASFREINYPTLQDIVAMKMKEDLLAVGIVNVADSETHRMVLQIHDRSISCPLIFSAFSNSQPCRAMNMPASSRETFARILLTSGKVKSGK
jgi:hypothetical protein